MRSGPNTLWFNTRSALDDIYGVRANVRKTDTWAAYSASRRSPNILSAIDKNVHAFKRRTIAGALSDRGLKKLEERILGHIKDFVALLGTGDGTSEDARGWMHAKPIATMCEWLSFDIIGEITYSRSFDMLHSPQLRWLPSVYSMMSLRGVMVRSQSLTYFAVFHVYRSLPHHEFSASFNPRSGSTRSIVSSLHHSIRKSSGLEAGCMTPQRPV